MKQKPILNALVLITSLGLVACSGGGKNAAEEIFNPTDSPKLVCNDPEDGVVTLVERTMFPFSFYMFVEQGGEVMFANHGGDDLGNFTIWENSGERRSGHTSFFPQDPARLTYDEIMFATDTPFSSVQFTVITHERETPDDPYFPGAERALTELINCGVPQ